MQTIYLDISNKGVVPTIYAKQGDVGRKFEVVFTDSGIPYSIPTNAKISIWYEGDSGVGNYTDIGENSAIAIGENKAVVELITQMLSEDGEGVVCLVMNAGNNQIGSWNIRYLCERVPGFDSEGAKEYYTAFSKTVESLKQVTENLTPEAIGAAPAGFGLGEAPPIIADANDATLPGFYSPNGVACANIPNEWQFLHGTIIVSTGVSFVEQLFLAREIMAKRTYTNNDGWGEWEYINPPMLPGVEYRTTERWNGSPVYCKAVDCGEIPSGTAVAIYTDKGAPIGSPIRCSGLTADGISLPYMPYVGDRSTDITVGVQNSTIFIAVGAGHGNKRVYVNVWYIK